MNAIQDFEDMLQLLEKHRVRYLIIGGLAFIYHAKPRYTKDMDLWIDPAPARHRRHGGGGGGDLRRFPTVFDLLPAQNLEILAYDQRGLGRTSCPDRPYPMAKWVGLNAVA